MKDWKIRWPNGCKPGDCFDCPGKKYSDCLYLPSELFAAAIPLEATEPLAVACANKGIWLSRARKFPDRWVLNFDAEMDIDMNGLEHPIVAPTYAECEAKARAYLEGLEDREEK